MRTFASFVLAVFLFPVVAHAASVSELMTKMSTVPASTFSIVARAHQDDMYISVWWKGTAGYGVPLLDTSATVDIVQGDMKARLKGDVRMNADGVFVRIRETTGTFNNEFAHMNLNAYTKKWIQVIDGSAVELYNNSAWGMRQDTVLGIGAFGMELEDDSITIQSIASGGGTKHILQLKPDAAAEVARSLLDMLGGDRPVIQDFFPWRALAESLQFEVTVQENSQSVLKSRTMNMSVQGEHSYLVFDSTETFLTASAVVATPTDKIGMEAIYSSFLNDGLFTNDDSWMEEEWEETDWEESDEMMDTWEDTDYLDFYNGSFEDIDTYEEFMVTSDTCWPEDEATLVMLQRSGECPVEKVSRRLLSR